MIQAERDNLELICHIIHKEDLDVDLWRGELVESECRRDTIFRVRALCLELSSVHETKAEAVVAQQQYNGWLDARQKYGYTSSHDTKLITDKEEAQRVRHLLHSQGHPLTLTPTTNIRYLASTLSSRSSFDLPVLFIRKCIATFDGRLRWKADIRK